MISDDKWHPKKDPNCCLNFICLNFLRKGLVQLIFRVERMTKRQNDLITTPIKSESVLPVPLSLTSLHPPSSFSTCSLTHDNLNYHFHFIHFYTDRLCPSSCLFAPSPHHFLHPSASPSSTSFHDCHCCPSLSFFVHFGSETSGVISAKCSVCASLLSPPILC